MKVGIVAPFSWSFWGSLNEHADVHGLVVDGRLPLPVPLETVTR